jgi:hypothetical protein
MAAPVNISYRSPFDVRPTEPTGGMEQTWMGPFDRVGDGDGDGHGDGDDGDNGDDGYDNGGEPAAGTEVQAARTIPVASVYSFSWSSSPFDLAATRPVKQVTPVALDQEVHSDVSAGEAVTVTEEKTQPLSRNPWVGSNWVSPFERWENVEAAKRTPDHQQQAAKRRRSEEGIMSNINIILTLYLLSELN